MKTLLELEGGDCRYPFGDGPFLFCGDPAQDKSSYCSGHHEICFNKVMESLRGGDNPHASAAYRKIYSSTRSTLGQEIVA
jgi:hypothetical protein